MRRPRHLSPEERALWDVVARRATPLEKARALDAKVTVPAVKTKPAKPSLPEPEPFTVRPFRVGAASGARPKDRLAPSLAESLAGSAMQMDAKSFGRLKKGKLSPEGRIDLHGMTMAEAHPALVSFILSSQANDKRLVLVITGKGKDRDEPGPIPTRHGVLRHQVPQWLTIAPLRQAILQVTPAHLKHGGHGAYYVYLRRNR